MRFTGFWIAILSILLLIHIFIFRDIRYWVKKKKCIHFEYIYLLIAGIFFASIYFARVARVYAWSSWLMIFIFSWIIANTIYFLFLLIDAIRIMGIWTKRKAIPPPKDTEYEAISRSQFLRWMGLGIAALSGSSLVYGTTNKYRYEVKKVPLLFPNLPKAFNGLRMIQISDIHSGSFAVSDKSRVQKGIDLIGSLKPDLIVFTGDLVNNEAKEMNAWIDVFSQLKAPFGVYSILGNHDYGWYKKWKSKKDLNDNMNHLFELQKNMGWKLLRNESIILQKGNEKIALIGVENWSAKGNYPNYGNLKKATQNVGNIPFQILLSHDPSHWRGEVLKKYPHIDLTLSGHTHGGQFALENPLFTWSPVQYVYHEWKGLYQQGKQRLYVNVGFGCLGYQGRVGVLPEITCFELQRR